MIDITVRAAGSDLDKAIHLAREEIYDDTDEAFVKQFLSSTCYPFSQVFVAEDREGEIVGTVAWMVHDVFETQIILEVPIIAVREELWRQGIGKKLLLDSLEQVKAFWALQGLRVVGFKVHTEEKNNDGPIAFYDAVLAPVTKVLLPDFWEEKGGTYLYHKRIWE